MLGGKPRLEDHRISVLDVTGLLDAGYSIEEAADQLDITPEEVNAARQYYGDHPEEMERLERRAEALYQELIEESDAPSE